LIYLFFFYSEAIMLKIKNAFAFTFDEWQLTKCFSKLLRRHMQLILPLF
jgi:hypothetical protein